jgi:CubicO group peptidase (beta-lactamase class C family)
MPQSKPSWPLPVVSPESVGLSSKRLEVATRFIETLIAERKLAGAITLVARRGGIAHLKCHGMQDIEQNVPMREDAIFRIYSMTKPIVCAAILMLYEECRLWLADPVERFLPEFADLKVAVTDPGAEPGTAPRLEPLKRDITIHDLLTHTGGLSYAKVHEFSQAESGAPNSDSAAYITALCREPLLGQPGEKWRYSGSNDVLGRVIEVVSGQSLDEFLEQRIFQPLGMVDTGFFVPPEKHHRLAQIYTHNADGHIIPQTVQDRPYLSRPAFLSGGGGLVSTTCDYLRFALALLRGGALDGQRILSPKTVELMRQDHLPPGHPPIEPFKISYGYGVSVVRSLSERQGIASVGEFGWGGAAGTNCWIDPQEDMVSMIMLQLKPSSVPMIDHRVKVAFTQAIVG